jgi:hypothetical protein
MAQVWVPVSAQVIVGVVNVAAPIFLRPDASRTPLRVLDPGTRLEILDVQEDWIQARFPDANLGPRVGWIERRAVTIRGPEPAPVEVPGKAPAKPPQPAKPAVKPPVPYGPLGVRGFATLAFDRMLAEDSFEAITGSSALTSFGGGVQVTNIWQGLFAEVSAERSSADGERVFVDNGDVFPLGIPLEVTTTSTDIVGGWRWRPVGRYTGFAGGGITFVSYEETSDFAGGDEDVDERQQGFVLLGGVEVAITPWLHLRGEMRYRQVNDILGVGGVSAEFDENKLGGFGGGVKLAVGK